MINNKILIISYYFFPEENPRSQRAYELAKEFSKRGFDITVVTKKLRLNRTLSNGWTIFEIPIKFDNVDRFIPYAESYIKKTDIKKTNKKPLNLRFNLPPSLQLWKLFIWPNIQEYEFHKNGLRFLKSNGFPRRFALTISIAYPYSCHILTMKLRKQGYDLGTVVGDCSDPYTYNPGFDFSIINYFYEKRLLSYFDYLTLPTERAIPAFTKLGVTRKKIRIISQGFSMDLEKDSKFYFPNEIEKPLMLYGGAFYRNIRNPENFFDALCLLKNRGNPFHFFVFTELSDSYVKYLIGRYEKQLSNNLTFHEILSRNLYLDALRQTDYAINFENNSEYQKPSKLIDYAIAKVKTIDIRMDMSPETIASDILKKKYYIPKINPKFDIKNVVDKFLSLRVTF